MSKNIRVELTDEHLSRVSKVRVLDALREFIWNASDADAENIYITYNSGLGELQEIVIKDDGHGIDYEKVEEFFGNYGRSHKLFKKSSPKGRAYHGRLGEGRYKGFTIGNRIEWTSVYVANDARKYKFSILCDATIMRNISISDKELVGEEEETGVMVVISNLKERAIQLEDRKKVLENLNSAFAACLTAYGNISIYYEGEGVNPEENIKHIETTDIVVSDKVKNIVASIKIIEWHSGEFKDSYICGQSGITFEETDIKFARYGFAITVYILSSYFDELHAANLLSLGNTFELYNKLLSSAEHYVKEYMKEKLAQLAAEEVKNLKKEEFYPYKGEASTTIEKAERKVFDICAMQIHQYLPNFSSSPKPTKRLTYRLIQEALASNPGSLSKILNEVFQLPKEKQDDLADLLEKTTLSAIINTAKVISDRLLFLDGLSQILHENTYNARLKERSQLHKMLLNELWIFGEQYTYGVDDVSLKNVLKAYISYMGREELITQIPKEELSDLSKIPDICLWHQYSHQYEEVENLIIELKRPNCTLGRDELNQIDDYCLKVTNNIHFPKEKTNWTFILISTDYDDLVEHKLNNSNNKFANYYNSKDGRIKIYIKKWNEIIWDAKLKLEFLREKLDYQIEDSSEGIAYLEEKYSKYFQSQDFHKKLG